MEQSLSRALSDKSYEKRKNAVTELERITADAVNQGDYRKIHNIVKELSDMATSSTSLARSGAIMGMAGIAIALPPGEVAAFVPEMVPSIMTCLVDRADNKVRYFACESMYNVAKVAKGEMLPYFNALFDAGSQLVADPVGAVKNGAELLDRLLKDIVTEAAVTYYVPSPDTPPLEDNGNARSDHTVLVKAFSLERFIPLLSERIRVVHPLTRGYLVSWIEVLDSVPELELVSYLPKFLAGLLKYVGDASSDVQQKSQVVLQGFLTEIRKVAIQNELLEKRRKQKAFIKQSSKERSILKEETPAEKDELVEEITTTSETVDVTLEEEKQPSVYDNDETDVSSEQDEDDFEWVPGQGIYVDYAAIIEILIEHVSLPEEGIQSVCLLWLCEFLSICPATMIPFTAQLLPAILSSLASNIPSIQELARETNIKLHNVVKELPVHSENGLDLTGLINTHSLTESVTTKDRSNANSSPGSVASSTPLTRNAEDSHLEQSIGYNGQAAFDLLQGVQFDYGATVNALTLQFLSDAEEPRVVALEWLMMLHQKEPDRILALDETLATSRPPPVDGYEESSLGIGALLTLLSDPSERVLQSDLELLAQICSRSPDEHFTVFMKNLLSLFSTDRKLLETRGRTIIKQLCGLLNSERIYRTFAELLEADDDLEFASIMVQTLNLILITSPELSDIRKRLRSLDTKDGQLLFTIIYKCWSHSAIATFCLCLMAQAYEQACMLLQIIAELDITVALLTQIDKLVQLLESPVFTSLRLQLLEPEKYPYLHKAMYGLLMILPQSSAFNTLKTRLDAVSSLALVLSQPKNLALSTNTSAAGRTTRRTDDIRWSELLTHFRQLQKRRSTVTLDVATHMLGTSFPPTPTYTGAKRAPLNKVPKAESTITASRPSQASSTALRGLISPSSTPRVASPVARRRAPGTITQSGFCKK